MLAVEFNGVQLQAQSTSASSENNENFQELSVGMFIADSNRTVSSDCNCESDTW